MIYPIIRWRTQPPRLPHPWHLGKAFIYPYIGVVGLYTAVLAICWMLLGINPVEACLDFLLESAIVLSPLIVKLGILWLIYTGAYLLSLLQYELTLVLPIASAAAAITVSRATIAAHRHRGTLGFSACDGP